MAILSIVGAVLCVIGALWVAILAFQTSVLWGLGCLFIPFVSLFYVFTHWDESKTPFLTAVVGAILIFVGGR
jgi:hypothetical protein